MTHQKELKFLAIAQAVAGLSKDRKKKVGALALGPSGEVRQFGYNGFPRGVDDDQEHRHVKPEKLYWVAHAEENVVSQAARVGVSLQGCTLIVTTLFPCCTCARLIIQSGIIKVIAPQPREDWSKKWLEESQRSTVMFEEAGVEIVYLPEGDL